MWLRHAFLRPQVHATVLPPLPVTGGTECSAPTARAARLSPRPFPSVFSPFKDTAHCQLPPYSPFHSQRGPFSPAIGLSSPTPSPALAPVTSFRCHTLSGAVRAQLGLLLDSTSGGGSRALGLPAPCTPRVHPPRAPLCRVGSK